MFKDMLEGMTQMMETALKEKKRFLPLWYREWFGLFLKAYEPGRKVIYTSMYAFPMELLAAFDVVPFDFEVAGALMTTMNQGVPLMTEAEGRGYTMDMCSFHRAVLGGYYKNCFPRPDLLMTTSFYCDGKGKTNDLLSYLWNTESFFLDVPHEITRDAVRYVENQLREVATKLGEITGRKLDKDRLRESVRRSNYSRRLQIEILELLKTRPMPMNPKDMIGYSLHGNLFSGTTVKEMLDEQLIHDIKEKIAKGISRKESHRIFWFAWFPVYQENVFETFKNHQVGIPLCETYRVYWDEMDEDNPFEGMALKCLKNPFVGPASRRVEGMDKIKEDYALEGALLFATPACRHANSPHMFLKNAFAELGIPFLMLDMDISDPRGFQPEQIRTRLEGFIEVMDNKNRG
ncbi:MAG TPA: 2-hydroxyacyl-CoA dehydratase family protein [Desulfomonilia bacterium]|nr:2-hydroxyacyl-CoA dehydratase family protein [Desulfomonilia bacterium]